jgi:amidase
MSDGLTRRHFLTGSLAVASGLALGARPSRAASADLFLDYDALGQAELVRTGQVTPAELLEAAIRRAALVEPRIHSIVTPMFDRARARVTQGVGDGPFRGVPMLVKDLAEIEGVRCARGSRLFKDTIATRTNPIVTRMEAAGFVVFGKSATPEFGLLPSTSPRAFEATRNPWNLAHDPGGSSGGAAAAVASGLLPMAQGGDGGGSIRLPASCCGVFGLKPTRARVVDFPDPRQVSLSCKGFLSRSVRDSQAALATVQAPSGPGAALPPVDDREIGKPRKLRIAFTTKTPTGTKLHPENATAAVEAAELCDSLGHEVEEVQPGFHREEMATAMITLWASGPAGLIADVTKQTGAPPPRDALEPWTWMLADHAKSLAPNAVENAAATAQRLEAEAAAFHERYDVLITSVTGAPPLRSGLPEQDQAWEDLLADVFDYVTYTYLANMSGRPGMSVPLHWTPDGLPVGSHFVGRQGEEALLFTLARQLEEARPWAGRRAPVFASA